MAEEGVSLREFIEEKFSSFEKSTNISRQLMDKRLEGMNEFREALRDQASKFITRSETDLLLSLINKDIKELQLSKATLEGKASQSSLNIVTVLSIISLIVSIVTAIILALK